MADIDRRAFNKLLGVGAAGLATGLSVSPGVLAQEKQGKAKKTAMTSGAGDNKAAAARVAIIGGGAGGASVAHQIKKIAPAIDVTLIEPKQTYTSCFFSNHYIGGFRSLQSLEHNYDSLQNFGVKLIHDYAIGVDTDKKLVLLKEDKPIAYDKLVLSPGIAMKYEAIEGYSAEVEKIMPHAWVAGEQTRDLRSRILDMRDGGTIVISVPANSYRCPPAPYERATLIAHYLKYHKPKSKLILLDAKSTFQGMELFEEVWSGEYKGYVEWVPGDKNGEVTKVIPNEMKIVTRNGDQIKADVANIISPQKAAGIAAKAGCTSGDWCPVVPDSFASRLVEDVFVLGDASNARKMPKSAFSANSQAHIVANAIAAQLTGTRMFPPRYRNTCWSLIAANNAIKSGASYTAGKEIVEERTAFASVVKEDGGIREANFQEALDWYSSITSEMFAGG